MRAGLDRHYRTVVFVPWTDRPPYDQQTLGDAMRYRAGELPYSSRSSDAATHRDCPLGV